MRHRTKPRPVTCSPWVRSTALWLLLLTALLSTACRTGREPSRLGRLAADDRGTTFLWEIQTPASTNFLLGSIHFATPDLYPLDPRIDSAFARSTRLAVEADVSEAQTVLPTILTRAFYTGDDTLKTKLSPEAYDFARDRLDALGLRIDTFHTFKPWFLAFSILGLELQKLGITPEHGIDLHFIRRAGERPILELESAGEQIELMDGFSDTEQEAMLRSTLEDAEALDTNMKTMLDSWKRGDITGLQNQLDLSFTGSRDLDRIEEKMLDDRNTRMVKKIEAYVASGQTHFVIVGAAHLIGPKSVVAGLRARGYTVRRI